LSSYVRERLPPVQIATDKSDREPLPIEGIIDDLLHNLLHSKKRVHLVVGPTGSGKSTWLPLKLVSATNLIRKGTICVTQPRIPATEGPASYIGFLYYGPNVNPSVGQGLIVGYRHSFVGTTMTDASNRLIFMTDGTLLNEIKNNDIRKYCVIMIDEAHERSINIDSILALLKEKLPLFTELRIIIASATVDAEKFIQYFGGTDQVETYYSAGFTYPILELFSDETVAHWPGGPVPMEKTSYAGLWEKLQEQLVDSQWLGPSPCYNFKPFKDSYRLRYYPQFESLVFQGPMTDEDKIVFLKLNSEEAWQNAVNRLYEESRREISVGESETVTIDQSIRGNLPGSRNTPDLYQKIDQRIQTRLVNAAVDTICKLVIRDETEAEYRHGRWEDRETYGWSKLEEPRQTGHILAFFPTSSTINLCAELLKKKLSHLPGNNEVFLYQRELSDEEKSRVTEKHSETSRLRKIILGTNLAETSLTLDGLVYVVDTGLILQTFYNSKTKGVDYPTILHSQAGCRQRLGRVGRKEPGEGYRLYTREELKVHPQYSTPEVTRSDPSQLILNLVSAGLPPSFIHQSGALMQPPEKAWINDKLTDLKKMGAIDEDGDLTSRGEELTRIPENNLWHAVLLCEADRFGCIWEMAVFLGFLGLNDKIGPDRQTKWLSLWVPDGRKVFEDELEEKLFDDLPETEPAVPASKDLWVNPYVLGSALIKQQALRRGCLDDLELYMRIWQGWISQGDDPEKKIAWAEDHGISAEALFRVERILGLDSKDTSETGTLRHFWAFGQKGIMKRDILFESLDKVRYLYAAANHENHFEMSPAGELRPTTEGNLPPAHGNPLEIKFEPESVWHNPKATHPLRFDKPARPDHLVAAVRIKPRRDRTIKALRHTVWLDPKWVNNGMPSLYDNPVHLAKTFAGFSDDHLMHFGKQPFARGAQISGLPRPMPVFPVPSPLEIQQWRVRYSSGMQNRTTYPAVFLYHIPTPGNVKALGFVQLISGPLLPMALKGTNLSPEAQIQVFLKYDETSECLWAVLPKPKIESDPRPPAPCEEPPAPVEQPARIIDMPRPEPIDFQKILPANSVVIAEFITMAVKQDHAWITVAIPVSDAQKKQWSFPVYKQTDIAVLKDSAAGTKCRVRIKEWSVKKGHPVPKLTFIGRIS
jgi:HrpA-like RNA helicase